MLQLGWTFILPFLVQIASSSPATFEWGITKIKETRSIDEIYQAALAEGGVVTLWHGGGSVDQQEPMKQAFEQRFPGMTLNVTVDGSKHISGYINQQLANGNLYVDCVMTQLLQDFPTWKDERVLMNYMPLGFDRLYPDFRDIDGAYYGVGVNGWSSVWNDDKLNGTAPPLSFDDFLRPEFRDRLVLNYPNDDDAVLYTFHLLLREYGRPWFEALLAQNPLWVRGSDTIARISDPSSPSVATFTTTLGLRAPASLAPLNVSWPSSGAVGEATFTTWPQRGAIFRDAPHPEAAKLLACFVLSPEWQAATNSWSVRRDVESPYGFPGIMEMPGTDVTKFAEWMGDREGVEALRLWFDGVIGTPQGGSVPWGDVVNGYPYGRSGE